jgi:histidine ammonia-lyase
VSMATHGALRLHRMLANTEGVIAIELLAAAEGIDFRRPMRSSEPLEAAHAAIRAVVPPRHVDRAFSDDIASMRRLIAGPLLAGLVGPLL